MNRFSSQFKKAALQNAAFFIFVSFISCAASSKPLVETLDGAKARATAFLLQKQKKQALQVLSEYIKNESGKTTLSEANEFLVRISQTFISKEAQEAYETSIIATVDNYKEAVRQVELCLQLEPQNGDCLVQKIRLASRARSSSGVESNYAVLKEILAGTKLEQWVSLAVKKNEPEFKNKTILKKLNEKPSEDQFTLAILELDRSFAAKNFSRAKDVIDYLDKNFSDWPDLVYYKQKIETESAEEKPLAVLGEASTQYAAKCKSLSKSVARKYRYDFDLCIRGT